MLTSKGVHIDRLTLVGGATGVVIQQKSDCVVTNCTVNGDVFGEYLVGAPARLVSNRNLHNTGVGIYTDGSAGNKLLGNSASSAVPPTASPLRPTART